MTNDRYLRFILTVIAGCLLYLCAVSAGVPLGAQNLSPAGPNLLAGKPQPVVIVGWGAMDGTGRIALHTVRASDGSTRTESTLPVRLAYTAQNPLPVGLNAVTKSRSWDSILVTQAGKEAEK